MTHYACKNRPPYQAHMKVLDGYWDDGLQRIHKIASVPFRMNPACQYTHTALGAADGACAGCKHKVIADQLSEPPSSLQAPKSLGALPVRHPPTAGQPSR